MSKEESRLEYVEKILDFMSSIDGIEWCFATYEGFPVALRNIDQHDAEMVSALIIDLSSRIKGFREIKKLGEVVNLDLIFSNKSIIASTSIGEFNIVVMGNQRVITEVIGILDRLNSGNPYKCSFCGRELELVSVACPSCGKTVPFTSPLCTFCGADLRVKRCPRCNSFIGFNGSKPRFNWRLMAPLAITGLLVAGVLIPISLITSPWLMVLGIGFGGIMVIIGYINASRYPVL